MELEPSFFYEFWWGFSVYKIINYVSKRLTVLRLPPGEEIEQLEDLECFPPLALYLKYLLVYQNIDFLGETRWV